MTLRTVFADLGLRKRISSMCWIILRLELSNHHNLLMNNFNEVKEKKE